MKLSVGFSSCPNDTFMFYAMVHQYIDCEGLSFQVHMADIEQLNVMASNGIPDITKLSIGAFADVAPKYALLHSGSALGFKNGPLLVSKQKIYPDEINELRIAIPGVKTTANLLLSILYPDVKVKIPYLFSDIEEAVLSNEVDAGLIIHENRFTYQKRGLQKVVDLGEIWEQETKYPIPLGSIGVRRDFEEALKQKIDRILHRSISFAFHNQRECYPYIKKHAQEIDDEVIARHIDLYVNEFSLALGKEGQNAIAFLLEKGSEANILKRIDQELFIKN